MIDKLIKLADILDKHGLTALADELDQVTQELQNNALVVQASHLDKEDTNKLVESVQKSLERAVYDNTTFGPYAALIKIDIILEYLEDENKRAEFIAALKKHPMYHYWLNQDVPGHKSYNELAKKLKSILE